MAEEQHQFPRGAVLDEISHRIGELTGYVHEHRHGVNNLATKFDGLALDIAKRVEALETRVTVRMEEQERALRAAIEASNTALRAELATANVKITALEAEKLRRDGANSVILTMLKSPTLGWLVGAATTAWAVLTGRLHL